MVPRWAPGTQGWLSGHQGAVCHHSKAEKWTSNLRCSLEIRDPGAILHRGLYPQREPSSSHFFIWLPKRNPVRTGKGQLPGHY
jgi:hypothetical protein